MNRTPRSFFSNVVAVAYKEASVLKHDKALLAAILAQPVLMLVLYSFALSNKPANVPWAVLDRNDGTLARRLVDDVMATGYFLEPRRVESYEQGREALKHGDVVALLVIPKEFRRDLVRPVDIAPTAATNGGAKVELLLDGSDPMQAARVGGYIAQVAAAFQGGRQPELGRTSQDRVRATGLVDLRQQFRYNPTLIDRDFFLAALAGMLLTNLCLSATSGGLIVERETGTYEQMLSLPTTPIEIVLGKLVPYVAVSYFVLLFATIAPGLLFGLWPEGSFLTLFIVTLPFVLASLSVGVFVSVLARTSAQAVFISVFFILPSFVLSGSMFPYQLMPDGVRQLGGLFPLRWYQIALRRIIERGATLSEVIEPTAFLIGLFFLILAGIRWRMKPRLA